MTRSSSQAITLDITAKLGRFDQSFIVKMIKDFFLLLLLVGALELGIRFALAMYDFYEVERDATRLAAERLAADIRSIMVNSGGPVAARTLYPILKNNHEARGLEIAIEPSEITITSIEAIYDFTPKGIPPAWSEGRHHAYTVVIEADEFCLGCHTLAKVGDPLGSVTVRNYLSGSLEAWWREVRISGVMSLFKIILDTMLLFFLLRIRLEPVLALRSVVSGLAKGASDLSFRAPVKSADEFGELAADLNLFLDRLNHILDDLGGVLAKVAALNKRLETVHGQMADGFEKISSKLAKATNEAVAGAVNEPLLSADWLAAVKATRDLALHALSKSPEAENVASGFEALFDQLEEAANMSGRMVEGTKVAGDSLVALAGDVRAFSHFMGEMAILEEKMQAIAETGQSLVDRLIKREEND